MTNWIIYAILAGVAMWAWWFFHDKSVSFINPIIWATFVSFIAMVIWIIIIYFNKDIDLQTIKNINYKWLFFIILVGFSAFLVDFLTLKTFSTQINISIWFPIIIIISIITSIILWIIFSWEILNYKQFFWILISIIWIYLILG